MSRESCITHSPKQAISIVRQDYYELTNRDTCAAALLNIFEYWANAAIAVDVTVERPWVGARPIREFEQMLLGIATDKQIRKRLAHLEEREFIKIRPPAKRGAAKEYQVLVPEIQQAISDLVTNAKASLWSNNRKVTGQITEEVQTFRSNDQPVFSQMTQAASVKQPKPHRLNDRALKKTSKEFKKEDLKEVDFCFSDSSGAAAAEPKKTIGKMSMSVEIGSVRYGQSPESIDLAELWTTHPEEASVQIRAIAPGHRRLAMVAHGLGQWWIGPGLNDFDEHLLQACRNRKRKFQQPDSVSDTKTFINNMIRNGDWANLSLRCDEAKLLKARTQLQPQTQSVPCKRRSPFERSAQERRESALGLARFKVTSGDIERAITISKQFNLSGSEIGLPSSLLSHHLLLQVA